MFSRYAIFCVLACIHVCAWTRAYSTQEDRSADTGSLVCKIETQSVLHGQPLRIRLEGTKSVGTINYQIVDRSNAVEVSGTLARAAATAEANNVTTLLVDTTDFHPGPHRLSVRTTIRGGQASCGAEFSIVFPTAAIRRPETENYQRVKLFFATDRAIGEMADEVQEFTSERATNSAVTLGTAEVSIPRDHRMGELERPSLLKLEFREDPEKHVVLLKASVLNKDNFLNELQNRVNADPDREALIFIHGYDTTFEEAARRLGQMTYDLGFPGAPILYSWPSKGALLQYTADEATIEWVIPHFEQFLHLVADQTEVRTIYLVAHSMGNRAVSGALKSMADKGQTLRPKLNEIVMAAPDIDAGVFQQLAAAIQTTGGHFTIYESSKDLALMASHRFHGFARLGDTDPTVHVFDGYDCIEASKVDTGFLGHSYVMESGSILADMFELLKGKGPALRPKLASLTLGGKTYWSVQP